MVETIRTRHFIQSAEQSGMPASTVQQIAGELVSAWPSARAFATEQLPKGFPARLSYAIVAGSQRRTEIIRKEVS